MTAPTFADAPAQVPDGALAPALRIGPLTAWPPVVLAPMAGITNAAFRTLCREFGGGLYVSEMITSRGLVEDNAETLRLIEFGEQERPRSLQLYGVVAETVGAAVRKVVEQDLADHVDLNMGCPVPKVTRRGGGAALPYKRPLFRAIVRAAVQAAGNVPVTVKMRTGIDDDHLTYLDAGRAAQEEGVAAVALHARTAAQAYSGAADWSHVARLKEALKIPVLGNGDVWSGADALRLIAQTGADGVVVGRGCLGRPWLFRSMDRTFAGEPEDVAPTLGEVAAVLRRHAQLLAVWRGEDWACRDVRKHVAWYLKGYPVGGQLRGRMAMVTTLAELEDLLGTLDPSATPPPQEVDAPRGRAGSPKQVALPEGWLDDPDDGCALEGAESTVSGG